MSERNPVSAERDTIVGVTPLERPCADLVIALGRAGALGVLDLGRQAAPALAALQRVAQRFAGPVGVRLSASAPDVVAPGALPAQVSTVILPGPQGVRDWAPRRVWVEVRSLEEARVAVAAGAVGLIAKGCESGGRIGEIGAFVLLQQLCAAELSAPIWSQGGIGLHTAAGAIAGGARGVVLDVQLALSREAQGELSEPVRQAIAAMDGSETCVLGGHRLYTRPDLPVAKLPAEVEAASIAARLGGGDLRENYLPIGQDGALAAGLTRRFVTAGGIARAIRTSIRDHLAAAQRAQPLAAGSPFARAHGLEYPIVQGPMTRVSDCAGFAAAVAGAGGLPFLALALMGGPEVRTLLEDTVERLGGGGRPLVHPWGVGILGFVPQAIRDAQLEVIRELRPPVALIAGGRPSQARALERDGIATYLHVPSPGLLRRFLRDGARRFVFEGRECGGHVGPRTSFALWESQLEVLSGVDDPGELDLLFAGGIHDARSAAMVGALVAPLVERGARAAVLMGSAYLLTPEAVSTGAIVSEFQDRVRRCERTVLLETAPGHAIRVAETPYVEQFRARKRELEAAGGSHQEVWEALETLNLGRLRLASKGIVREGDALRNVDAAAQRDGGMYMVGQVVALGDPQRSVAELHREVSEGGTQWLDRLARPEPEAAPAARPLQIAIVGMAGCFPDASDVDEFWTHVVQGVDAIREVPPERWDVDRYYDPDGIRSAAGERTPSKWGGFLPQIAFDALGYGIPPRSLSSIEPGQLLALEIARRALEDAGYAEREFDRERTSVIFGAAAGTDLSVAYGFEALYPQYTGSPLPDALRSALPQLSEDSFPGVLSNVIAGRIANRLDLGGVNYTADAACASSLAALHQACHELVSGSSDMVLCGAADLHNGIADYLLFASVYALSVQGRCRAFDAEADGIALGEGVACVALKRLEDAERDGDRIYAVIQGVAGASDGRSLGLTAPRPEGQRRAIERAYAQAGVTPAQVGVVEAHGTGTVVGDRTELAVLTEIFQEGGAQSVALGSVKSQIGHTKCAAGLASLIKSALSLYSGVRGPTLHVTRPNDYYEPGSSPFQFSASARPWWAKERTASLSAFGFGGSNFHAVLSSYSGADQPARGLRRWPAELLLIRGEDREQALAGLDQLAQLLAANARAGGPYGLRDVARTTSESGSGEVWIAIAARDLPDLERKLEAARRFETAEGVFVRDAGDAEGAGRIAWLFPGQGSQRIGMGAELFAAFPRLQRLLELGPAWADAIFPPSAFSPEERAAQQQRLTDTRTAQPALGMLDLALAEVLREFGVPADMAAGHSYGELVALCTAGVFDEARLIELSAARARAILEAAGDDPGTMAAVDAPAGEVQEAIAGIERLVVANENAPRQTVISGASDAVERGLAQLEERGIGARRIPVACAFHSPVVAGAVEGFAKQLAGVPLGEAQLEVWSNATARPYPADAPSVAEQLAGQIGSPVRFQAQIEAMYAAGARTFVEVGPGRVLTGLVGRILGDRPHRAICCDVPGESGLVRLAYALGELAVRGVQIDVHALYAGREARRIDARALDTRRPAYRVNGYTVRSADGEVVPGALLPADRLAELARSLPAPAAPGAGFSAPGGAGGREAAVQGFLRAMRENVATQREVMLAYLGAPAGEARAAALPELPAPGAEPLAAAPATAPATPAASVPRGDALMAAVLEIVTERTGYPLAMLEPDLDLEADLGIDSIKRMEILGELAERVSLPGMEEGSELDESLLEELARLKTLRSIVAWIDEQSERLMASAPAGDAGNAPAAARPTVPRGDALMAAVLEIVMERTGYPLAMLEPDLDLEADLGIDSIKRMEILGELAERVSLPGMDENAELDESLLEELARLKTLRSIVAWIDEQSERLTGAESEAPAAARDASDAVPERALRYAAELRSRPAPEPASLAGRQFLVAAGSEGLRRELAARIEARGGALVAAADGAPALTWIGLEPLAPAGNYAAVNLFESLRDAVQGGARAARVVTGLGGGLGLRFAGETPGLCDAPLRSAGARGLVKSFAAEFPEVSLRVVDVDPAAGDAVLADQIARELDLDAGPVEVGWSGGERWVPEWIRAELSPGAHPGALRLDAQSVVLVTGGARGIGARVALALARETGCQLELVGRSPLPESEPEHRARARDAIALRKVLIEEGRWTRPAEIEAELARQLASREIRATLSALEALGIAFRYHALDVRDDAAVRAFVRDLYERCGRLDGVVHAAGVLADRWIREKTPESFRTVFETKIRPLQVLARELRPDLQFWLGFGSIAGAFGNRGQVDYAAANDAMGLLGRALDAQIQGRVVTVHWGPWSGTGMVSDELASAYRRRGIGLIDPEDGAHCALHELRSGAGAECVVMRAELERVARAAARVPGSD